MNEQKRKAQQEQAIGRDLEKCDIGIAMTTGRLRARYVRHRKACMEAIQRMNLEDFGPNQPTDDELAASLSEFAE
jgi:hypothetical protein